MATFRGAGRATRNALLATSHAGAALGMPAARFFYRYFVPKKPVEVPGSVFRVVIADAAIRLAANVATRSKDPVIATSLKGAWNDLMKVAALIKPVFTTTMGMAWVGLGYAVWNGINRIRGYAQAVGDAQRQEDAVLGQLAGIRGQITNEATDGQRIAELQQQERFAMGALAQARDIPAQYVRDNVAGFFKWDVPLGLGIMGLPAAAAWGYAEYNSPHPGSLGTMSGESIYNAMGDMKLMSAAVLTGIVVRIGTALYEHARTK